MASRDIVTYRSPFDWVLKLSTGLFLAAFTVWTVLPIFVMFMSSIKDLLEAFRLPPVGDWTGLGVFFDFTPTFSHYVSLFRDESFGTYLGNSILAALGSALI